MDRSRTPRPRSRRSSSCCCPRRGGRVLGARAPAHRAGGSGAEPGRGPRSAAAHAPAPLPVRRRLGERRAVPATAQTTGLVANPWLAAHGHADHAWLARAGRFAQPQAAANTLGAVDDAQALALSARPDWPIVPHAARLWGRAASADALVRHAWLRAFFGPDAPATARLPAHVGARLVRHRERHAAAVRSDPHARTRGGSQPLRLLVRHRLPACQPGRRTVRRQPRAKRLCADAADPVGTARRVRCLA
jgi:hypothetical protein